MEDAYVDDDESLINDIYENFLDGMEVEGGDADVVGVYGTVLLQDSSNEGFQIDTAEFIENTTIQNFFMTTRTVFAALKRNLVEKSSVNV